MPSLDVIVPVHCSKLSNVLHSLDRQRISTQYLTSLNLVCHCHYQDHRMWLDHCPFAVWTKMGRLCNTLELSICLFPQLTKKQLCYYWQRMLLSNMCAQCCCRHHSGVSEKVKPEIPYPVDHGWTNTVDGLLKPIMFKQEYAPVQVRDLTHLHCNDKNCIVSRKCCCLMVLHWTARMWWNWLSQQSGWLLWFWRYQWQ